MDADAELLKRFADEGAQDAFAALVQRKVDLVYAAALRQTGGDAHLAHDVTQGVFLALACQAAALRHHSTLTGWLYTTTRFLAVKAVRAQSRWQRREQEAQARTLTATEEPAWSELRPVIDAAMHELGETDRAALLLRFFEGKSFAEVATACGAGSDNAARMRVERALEKLRARLARHGITSTAAALGATLASQPVLAAPAGVAGSVTAVALAGAQAGTFAGAAWLGTFMSTTKVSVAAAGVIAALGLGAYLGKTWQETRPPSSPAVAAIDAAALARLRDENRGLRAALAQAPSGRAAPAHASGASPGTATPRAGTTLDALRVLMDLQRRKLVALDLKLIAGAQVTDQFAELFGLSASEREKLQHDMDAARHRLDALERENTSVARAPNGNVLITVKPYPEAGGAAYDALLTALAGTLGPERHAAFLALGAEQMEKSLGRFGTARKNVTLSRETLEGEARYRINSRVNNAPGENANYTSDWLRSDEFSREIGPLAGLVPTDFLPRR